MVLRSKSVGLSRCVQLDVPTQDMDKRTRLQKVNNPQGTFTVRCGIFNQQSTREQKISRKKNPGSVVVKCHVGRVVSGRRNYVHSSATQIEMGNSVGPVSETVKRSNSLQIYRHDLNRWKRCELRITGPTTQMLILMP